MKKSTMIHFISFLFLSLSPQLIAAQSGWNFAPPGSRTGSTDLYPATRFSASLAIIIAVLGTSLFFMVFFFIYIRYCSGASVGVARPPVPRRAAAAVVSGLDSSVIEMFPTFSYAEVKDHKIGKGALECAVCLNEFEDDETLRLLPKCDHVFHPECIDAWLGSHVTCPVCRADLVPQPGDEPVRIPGLTRNEVVCDCCNHIESSEPRNDDVVIQIDEELEQRCGATNQNSSFHIPNQRPKGMVNRNLSFQYPNRPPRVMNRNLSFQTPNRMSRLLSMRPRIFSRSQSARNILVQPGENLERFTLRLPDEVRKDVMNRASLNRTKSFATTLDGSSKKGYGMRIETPGREVKSERWDFFARALSMKIRSPKVVAEAGEGSSSGSTSKPAGNRTLTKLRSFNCLETKGEDETGFLKEPVRPEG